LCLEISYTARKVLDAWNVFYFFASSRQNDIYAISLDLFLSYSYTYYNKNCNGYY
jgi:hypothetical protein